MRVASYGRGPSTRAKAKPQQPPQMLHVFQPLPEAELCPPVQPILEMDRHLADVPASALDEELEAYLVANRIEIRCCKKLTAPHGEEPARRVPHFDPER